MGPHLGRSVDENSFLDAFYDLVGRLERDPVLEVVHVFDLDATKRALLEEGKEYPMSAKWSKRLLETIEADSSNRLHVMGVPPRLSPLMIADDTMMLGHHIGPRSRRGSFHMEVGEWATDTWGHVKASIATEGHEVADFLSELGLS